MANNSIARARPAAAGALRERVGLAGVVMFGAGTAIGVSIFTVLAPTAQIAGSGLLVAVLLAAVPMILFAVVYGFMSSAVPRSGASFEWPTRFVHPLVGFMIAWLRIVGNVGVMTVLTTVLIDYVGAAIPVPATAAKVVLITAIFAINYVGVAAAARAQIVMMTVLLVALGVFVASGTPHVELSVIGNPLAVGWPAIFAAVPLMISLFLGIESATEIGEEVRNARRTIPLGIALAVGLTAAVYLLVSFVTLGLLGPERLAASTAPLLEAAQVPLGTLATPIMLGAAAVAILKTMNSSGLVFSRFLFAMGRSGALPLVMGRVHPRFGTPHVAIIVAWLACLSGLLMPSNLVFLLLAVNIPTMLKYLASSWSAVRLVNRHPELHAAAALAFRASTVRMTAWAAILCGAGIIVAGLGADWRPYALIGTWGVAGLAWWFVRARRTAPGGAAA
ncbi:MAG TPA: amino acid permease [Woeseiaceae bacterium]|nr:amino acid permease [Woeseiaceae bacterium]